MTVEQLDEYLLVGTGVLLAAILAVRLSVRAGLPSLLVYLLMGVALGESGLGINFEDAALAHALGFGALALILAEGGITTRWSEVRSSIRLGGALASVGVAVSVGVMAVLAHWLLGLDWRVAILLGAVTSPTDAAAVFSVLRHVPLPRRLAGTLESESGLNDAPTVLLVTLVSTGAVVDQGPLVVAGIMLYELATGVVVGLAVGWAGAWVLRRVALASSGLYPVAVLAFAIFAYAGASALHASGFAAVYVAALVLGNAELPHRLATRSFSEGIAWLAQIGLFVMLGLLASPGRITFQNVVLGLVAGALLTFVARPLSVAACAGPLRMPWREQAFMAWAGLRGAVPIVLATIPLANGVNGADDLFDLVFVMVIFYTLVQGPTLPMAARLLGVTTRGEVQDVDVEAAPLDRLAADLLQVRIPVGSQLHGVEVQELRLPKGVSVSLVVRGDDSFVPDGRRVLRTGDDLLVVTPRRLREATEERLRAVGRGGRLAGWLGEATRYGR
ncbi:MAG TPA: potassium/proton antiporter [Nocardioidaceae bacterium]|nr:potassium/proton antiporter [Nocardioidaceae bacterium]